MCYSSWCIWKPSNSFESLPSWDVDSLGCIRDTPFSFETLTDLFITLPYYFEKLPVWFERICDIFQILLLSLWHFLSCLKHILTWWVSSIHLRCTCYVWSTYKVEALPDWLSLTCPRPFMTSLRPVFISLFDTLPDMFETPWHIVTFLNYWRLLLSVWGIYLFETLPNYFESVPGLFKMICDGWDTFSNYDLLCLKGWNTSETHFKTRLKGWNVFETLPDSLRPFLIEDTFPKLLDCLGPLEWASLVAQTVRIFLLCGRPGFNSWVRKIPWRREGQSTLVFLPGKSHGQRLAGYSPWSHKELDATKQLTLLLSL